MLQTNRHWLRFVVSHPSRKNKNAARVAHPACVAPRAGDSAFVCDVPRLADALDGYRFENDGRLGLVLSSAGNLGDFVGYLLALDNFAEDGEGQEIEIGRAHV